MLVAATTDCFPDLTLTEAIHRLIDLEFTGVELVFREGHARLSPTLVLEEFDQTVGTCRDTNRLNVVAYTIELDYQDPRLYEKFAAMCRLAKATKVVQLTVPSGELGTPFNEEVERLRKLVSLATLQGARVGIRSQIGRLSEDPDTVVVLCDNVKGLGVSLDPSHYICGPHRQKNYEKLLKYVYHVYLRDTSKTELQVRVGQGQIEYSRLLTLLRKQGYDRALSIDIREMPNVDHVGELRKMRLLLESFL